MRLARVNVIRLDSRGDCPPSGGTGSLELWRHSSSESACPLYPQRTLWAVWGRHCGASVTQSAPSDDGVVEVATSPARLAAGRAF
jgi:hypothetical protein